MSAVVITKFDWVFNDVQFALDLREARKAKGMTQQQVAEEVGYETGTTISSIEQAKYTPYFAIEKFLKLCNLFDLHAFDYWEIERQFDKKRF